MDVIKFLEIEAKNKTESHAYLLIGNRHEADRAVDFFIKSRNILPVDILSLGDAPKESKLKEIKVEETRELLRQISFSPAGKQRLVIIYSAENLNASSGNVLLKSIEEPVGPIVFVLIANSPDVLSTIKSRCRVINLASNDPNDEVKTEKYITVIKKGWPEATLLIEKITKNGEGDSLLQELMENQRKKLLQEKIGKYAENLKEIELAKRKINQNGNVRLVLECLILKIGESL